MGALINLIICLLLCSGGFAQAAVNKADTTRTDSTKTAILKTADSTSTMTVVADSDSEHRKDSVKTVRGIASFYSKSLDGTHTSTGEIYRHSKMTAASNHFKLNTWVRVTNLRNGRSVIVRINDHMHKKMSRRGRVVDLSRTAAKELGFVGSGLTKVKVEEVPKGTEE